jgi:hypothetical protein
MDLDFQGCDLAIGSIGQNRVWGVLFRLTFGYWRLFLADLALGLPDIARAFGLNGEADLIDVVEM